MKSAVAQDRRPDDLNVIMGKAHIVRSVFEGRDFSTIWNPLFARVSTDLGDAAAFLDASIFLRAIGREQEAAISEKAALDLERIYWIRNGNGTGPTVLVFVTAGDFMANTPIEFLLEGSNATVVLCYVDAQTRDLGDVPPHDVAFVGVGESADNIAVLENLKQLLQGWQGPIVNNAPDRIAALSRDGVAEAFRDEPTILAPAVARADRSAIERLAMLEIEATSILEGLAYPFIIRPIGSHAGKGLEKIASREELENFLRSRPEAEFFVSPFVDYSGKDGKFRKQRVAFINGRPFASHLAVSDHWMVHYLNAGMAQHAERRVEEAQWMAGFDVDFAPRHARAFDALCRRIGLDYFAVDCAELADGRLLLFEVDVAMIVHSMDPATIYPYKKEPMHRLFLAFEDALVRRAARSGAQARVRCAHSGKPPVYQRTADDCLICVLAMFTGRTYEDIVTIARSCDPAFPAGGPMSHSVMRAVANRCGFVLLSGIYMLWAKPAIIGVVSPTTPDTGHAVLWDGEKIIDPGISDRVDRSYIDRCGLEFTQRAIDLEPLIAHEARIACDTNAAAGQDPA